MAVKQLRISLDSSIVAPPIQRGWCPCSASEGTVFDETDKFILALAKRIKSLNTEDVQAEFHQLRLRVNQCEEVTKAQDDAGLKEKMQKRMKTIQQRAINVEGALNVKTPKAFHLVRRTSTSEHKD